MANPHHRKKHKEHLKQFQHRGDMSSSSVKGKGSYVFAIVGAVMGLVVSLLASSGNIIWLLTGTLIGAAAGYLMGKGIENSTK